MFYDTLLTEFFSDINCKMVFSVNQSCIFSRSFSAPLILAFSSISSVNQMDIMKSYHFSSVNSHLGWEWVQEKLDYFIIPTPVCRAGCIVPYLENNWHISDFILHQILTHLSDTVHSS